MRKYLLTALAGWSLLAVPVYAAPILSVTATDNGTALTFVPTTNVPGDLNGTFTDPNFNEISVNITGVPSVPSPDLGTVTLNVLGSAGGTHVLNIVAVQSGLTQPVGFNGMDAMTFDNTIGAGGPATETFAVNGSVVATGNFAVNPVGSSAQNFSLPNLPAITSDAQAFSLTFTAANQDIEATQEFTQAAVAVSEPSTLAMFGAALSMLGFVAWRRRHQ